MKNTCLLTAMLALFAATAHAAACKIADDRMAVINGQRTFILGLYEFPKEKEVFDAAVKAGFNLFRTDGSMEQLDQLQGAGVYAWVNTGAAIELPETSAPDYGAKHAALEDMVNKMKDHPAMLVWEVPDEALWNVWYGAQLARENDEPKRLEEKIAALTDTAKQAVLRKQVADAAIARSGNAYAEAEKLADDTWRALGEKPPYEGYGLSNAPAREAALCAAMARGYAEIKKLDPNHPIWMNHAPRNSIEQLARFGQAADAVGCDIYPVPAGVGITGHSDLLNQTLSCVGDYTGRMQQSAPGKPVWMVLQGFGWPDIKAHIEDPKYRRPTRQETRFMAYDAIAHGARGILYWGTFAVEKNSPFWNDLLEVAGELSQHQAFLSAPDSEQAPPHVAPTYGSVDRTLATLSKQGGKGKELLVVNESPYTLTTAFPSPGSQNQDQTVAIKPFDALLFTTPASKAN